MRFVLSLFAVLVIAGCGGHATVPPPTTIDSGIDQTPVIPMDEQFSGMAFTNVNIVPSSLAPGISGLVQVPRSFQITDGLPQDRVFITYNYFNGTRTTSSTGSLTASNFVVDANKNINFTVSGGVSKFFRVPLSSTTPSIASCTLLQAANNGIALLPNGTFAVGDAGNHINIVSWPSGGTCTTLHRRMNPFGGSIRSITADPSNNIYFSDSHRIQRLTTTGVFQTVATPPTGFTPEEVDFKFDRLLFTYIANTGTAGKVGTLSGSTIHLFNVPSLSRGFFAADLDKHFDIWYAHGNASVVSAIDPSGTTDSVVDSSLPSTFLTNSVIVGSDGQTYFAAPNSRTMGIFNGVRLTLSPTSLSVLPGEHKTFSVFETLQPFFGTNPGTYTAQGSNNAVAKLSSFTNSGVEGTGTILGVAPGSANFVVRDGLGNWITMTVTVP